MEPRDRARLLLVIELTDLIEERIATLDRRRFVADRHEVDLAAYRVSMIGETTNKLSAMFKSGHPEMNWPAIYAMRNIIAHDYGRINPDRLWAVLVDDLPQLAQLCRIALGDEPIGGPVA